MSPSISSLIGAHVQGDERSLTALAAALAQTVRDTPGLPTDPVALYEAVDVAPPEAEGTWQEVRAARDYGSITAAEYDYLAAAVEALTQEDRDGPAD